MKYKAILSAQIVLTALCCGCENPVAEKHPRADTFCLDESFKSKIEFVQATKQQITQGIHLTGNVEANPDKVISFISLVSGVVSNTHFSLGDRVAKGQLLAELKSAELSMMQSEFHNTESRIKVAEARLKATQSLFADGISSQKELAEAQSELDILLSEKQKIENNLSLFSASSSKDVFQIKAPASGIITSKSITPGMQISGEGEPLFTLSDLNDVWIMVNIHTSNHRDIHEGMEVNIKTLSYPDEVFKGKVSVISHVLDNEAKVLKARIVLQNTDFKLKPGMLVDVVALKKQDVQAVSVPTSVIVFSDNRNYVLVYKNDCEIEARKIEIAAQNNGTTFIAEGLQENEKIISKNQLLVFEGIGF